MITSFSKENSFLSNFYLSPVVYDLWEFPSVEHAFQASKTNNDDEKYKILKTPDCRTAKLLGRSVTLRPDWEDVKYDIMEELLSYKFRNGSLMAHKLIQTRHQLLVEGNTWHDQTWGQCKCERHKNIAGQNALGIILMNIRLKVKDYDSTS